MSGGMWSFDDKEVAVELVRVTLPTTEADIAIMRDQFLESEGLEVNEVNKHLFCSMIQHLPSDQDWIDSKQMARSIRKALINASCFYLMYPDKKPKEPSETVQEVPEAASAE